METEAEKPTDAAQIEDQAVPGVLTEPRYPIFQRQTWELELLVSGAIVFTLFQLPSAIDGVYFSLAPHLSERLYWVPYLTFYYIKLIVYMLIITFSVHFTGRAYWVGLIGLNAVFPKGIKKDNLEYGPLLKDFYDKRLPNLSQLAKNVDRFCRSIFSFSFVIIFFLAFSIVFMGLISGLTTLLSLFLGRATAKVLAMAIMLLLLVPGSLMQIMDKKKEKQGLDPDAPHGFPKLFRRILPFYFYGMVASAWAPVFLVFSTNIKKKILFPILAVMFLTLISLFVVDMLVKSGALHFDSYVFFPQRPDAHSVAFQYYDELRPDDGSGATKPSIPSEIITHPFIKLFIPYYPRRDNPNLQKIVGDHPLQKEGLSLVKSRTAPKYTPEDVENVLAGLAQLYDVFLNDAPLVDPEFFFYEHPQTGVRGIVTYIPTGDLPKGKNVLRIEKRPDVPNEELDADARKKKKESGRQRIHTIPFWLG